MQASSPSPDADQRQAPSRSRTIRKGTLWVAGAVAVAACCVGVPLLLAAGGGMVASVAFGAWGVGIGFAGLAAWAVWRRRKKRVCVVDRSPQGGRRG